MHFFSYTKGCVPSLSLKSVFFSFFFFFTIFLSWPIIFILYLVTFGGAVVWEVFFLPTFLFSGAFNIWMGIWWQRQGGTSLVHVVYLLPFHRHIAFSSTKSGWWDFYRAHLVVNACVWARGWSAPKQVLHFGWTWVYFSTNPDLVKEKNCAAVIPPWLPFEYHSSYKLK